MKKILIAVLLFMATMTFLSGCKGNAEDNKDANVTEPTNEGVTVTVTATPAVTEVPKEVKPTSPAYTTILEGFDWGPAITKVILDIGIPLDDTTLSPDSFAVTCVKEYILDGSTEPTVIKEERKVTAVYISDVDGNIVKEGSYITIEMKVGPNLPVSSPFYSSANGLNKYADTSYIVKVTEGSLLMTPEGKTYTMKATKKEGYQGNKSLIAEDFDINGFYIKDNIPLSYASFIPETASDEQGTNPLIIWLHGSGEGGTDPSIALLGNKVVNLATEEIQSHFGETGAYILVPQTSTTWMDYNGTGTYNNEVEDSEGKSYYTEALMGLIEEYVASHPEIDKFRIYIGGCSDGGYMTMNMIMKYPEYFAAAYPICEAYSDQWISENEIRSIKNMPIWLTHAKNDSVVKIYEGTTKINDYSNALYDRLISAGATNVHYSLFDNVVDLSGKYYKDGTKDPYEYDGHYSWIYALNNQCTEEIGGTEVSLFEWMSQQNLIRKISEP